MLYVKLLMTLIHFSQIDKFKTISNLRHFRMNHFVKLYEKYSCRLFFKVICILGPSLKKIKRLWIYLFEISFSTYRLN